MLGIREELKLYQVLLLNNVPDYIYEGLLSILCFGAILLLAIKKRKSLRCIAKLLLFEYIFLIYCSFFLFRITKDEQAFNYIPFWSYDKPELLLENIMNVVVFVPVGLLLGCAFSGMKWWKTLLIGAVFSVLIEIFQLVFKKGFSEIDDVMHNTLGCLIGFGIYALARYGYERICKRSVGPLVET